MRGNEQRQADLLKAALEHLRKAIDLLDQAEASGQIAAHVDLATHQLAGEIDALQRSETHHTGLTDSEKLQTS